MHSFRKSRDSALADGSKGDPKKGEISPANPEAAQPNNSELRTAAFILLCLGFICGT
jgi:hypothetical protein